MTFTYAPVHRTLRAQLEGRRAWVEQVARSVAGRPVTVVVREGQAKAAQEAPDAGRAASQKAELAARAKAEPSVQAVLDVFGGEIEDVEELK